MFSYTIHYFQSPVKEYDKMHIKTKEIVLAALMAALACVATMVIKIPSPLNGYINLGDCIVLVAGWILSPAWGFLAAGIGSARCYAAFGCLGRPNVGQRLGRLRSL